MNALAEKLKSAGVDTIGSRFTAACTEAIRLHPHSAFEAWRVVGDSFGYGFVLGLMKDMHGGPVAAESVRGAVLAEPVAASPTIRQMAAPAAYRPRVIPPERLEKRRELQRIVRSKYKNSGGVIWSDVGWHELHGLKRDGAEALALLNAGPAAIQNDGRTVGEVLGVKRVDEIIKGFRSGTA